MLKNASRDTTHWRTKTQQLFKVSSLCLDDHHLKREEFESVGKLSKTCAQIVFKCLYLTRIGRFWHFWSVNKFARAVTKWTRACDRRLARSIAYIHHTSDYRQYCHLEEYSSALSIGFIPRLRFLPAALRTQHQLRGNSSVSSHQLVESEVISLDVANGRDSCCWSMGCCDRSVTFFKEYRITNPSSSRKLFAESQIQTQTNGKPRCRSISHVTTSPRTQILLKASLSCTSLKTVKQWSRRL